MCDLCEIAGEHVLAEGSSSNVVAKVTITKIERKMEIYSVGDPIERKMEIYSVGDSSTSLSYYPDYCPKCGRTTNVVEVSSILNYQDDEED